MKGSPYGTVRDSYGGGGGGGGGDGSSSSAYVFDVGSKEEFESIVSSFPIVVVDVWAGYCNPCNMMAPKYADLALKFRTEHQRQQVIFVKDNIETNVDIHKPLVTVVPTFFMYVHGKRYHIPDFREMEITVQTALNDIATLHNTSS